MKPKADLVHDAQAMLGEGALWDGASRRLLWVDILGMRVGLFDPATGENRRIQLDSFVGTVVPAEKGDLMVAVREGFARVDRGTGALSGLKRPEGHNPQVVRFNDGKCDPAGRFWAGSMAIDESGRQGALYCLDTAGTLSRKVQPVAISNGITWSLDRRTLYYIDTPTLEVAAFDYDDDTGSIGNRRTAFSVPQSLGWPDGMTIDADGMLWIALWDGWAVTRWDPRAGRLLETIPLPMSRVTSCAFGGPGLDTLFVTSARVGLSPEALQKQPHAGSIFAVDVGARGVPAFAYRG